MGSDEGLLSLKAVPQITVTNELSLKKKQMDRGVEARLKTRPGERRRKRRRRRREIK